MSRGNEHEDEPLNGEKRPRLYSYCIPIDDGAAPNPYFGVCTLAICKPIIRRMADEGDWIVGLGAKRSADKQDHSGKVVYAMHVTEKLTFEEYDRQYPMKRPRLGSRKRRHWVGDNIYDFHASIRSKGGDPSSARVYMVPKTTNMT